MAIAAKMAITVEKSVGTANESGLSEVRFRKARALDAHLTVGSSSDSLICKVKFRLSQISPPTTTKSPELRMPPSHQAHGQFTLLIGTSVYFVPPPSSFELSMSLLLQLPFQNYNG